MTNDVEAASQGVPAPVLSSIDLFAGAGGLTAGLAIALPGLRTVQAVEHDAAAAATFEANHGAGVSYPGPVEEWLLAGSVPEVDLVLGGPPCQGFSQLNRRRRGDERNALWESYAEVIALARPRWFVMENVATFLKTRECEQFRSWTEPGGILEDYSFEARVMLAADFGAPQLRRRTVVLGHRRDVSSLAWPRQTHLRDERVSVREAWTGLSPGVATTQLPQKFTLFHGRSFPGSFRTDELHVTRDYQEISKRRFRAIPAGGNRFDLPENLKAPCWVNHRSGSGDVMGRLMYDRPSVTIRTEFFKPEKGRYLHPTEHRAITHQEAARLQGFPDDYRWVGSKTDIARQIGNAVPLALGEALGKSIRQAAFGWARHEIDGALFS
ncbi:DNA cytosine methyltransferase [Arsenicicoccus cauae]|uniref:DNA cytosine methyltransferase n=1 Tax=Arsenicicoccus cauae TaxID=2663847 RepID=UPI00370D6D4F